MEPVIAVGQRIKNTSPFLSKPFFKRKYKRLSFLKTLPKNKVEVINNWLHIFTLKTLFIRYISIRKFI